MSWRDDSYDFMIGKAIESFDLAKDGSELKLKFTDGTGAQMDPYGDCCSTTWIESMDAPEALLGVVQGVEDIDMPNLGNVPTAKQDCVDQVSYYGLRITTNKGRCVIDYRNDSNGYYGGSLGVRALADA